MEEETMVQHIRVAIDGLDYTATFFVEDSILHVAINGKSYSSMATDKNAEATVRAMMIEEALKDSLRYARDS